MKKLLMSMIVLLISGTMMAQKVEVKKEARHFLALHGGVSIPLGDFGSTSLNPSSSLIADKGAGFAKTGFNINLTYGYKITDPIGITASAFYNNHKLDISAIQREMEKELDVPTGTLNSLKMDHFQWYGISAGPMFTQNISSAILFNLRVMGGVANVNSPKTEFENSLLIKEDWSAAPLFRGGVDFLFDVGGNLYIFTSADYLYMKPKFTMQATIENETFTETAKQNIAVVNLSGGLALRF
ncbi:MAG: hypothetical protein ACM3H8_15255 [Sphingobacteriales bacterium]